MDRESQLLSLHSTMVSTACASETRRQGVSVASAGLISGAGALFATGHTTSLIYLTVPLLIVSSIWFVTVRFYQQLAKWKWKVVEEIEVELAAKPFTREWELFKKCRGPLAFGPSTLEQVIPALVFMGTVIYILIYVMRVVC